MSDLERLIYSVALTGAVYEKDNKSAWWIIQAATIGTQSYEWVRSFGDKGDNRGAVHLLVKMCEGEALQNKRLPIATQVI